MLLWLWQLNQTLKYLSPRASMCQQLQWDSSSKVKCSHVFAGAGPDKTCLCMCVWVTDLYLTYLSKCWWHTCQSQVMTPQEEVSQRTSRVLTVTDFTDTAEIWRTPWRDELPRWVVNDALKHKMRTQANNSHFIFTDKIQQIRFFSPHALIVQLFILLTWNNIYIYLSVWKRCWAAGLFYAFVYTQFCSGLYHR